MSFGKLVDLKTTKNSPEKADISLRLSKNYSSMSVDIGTYRSRIGLFQSVNCNQKKPKYKLSRCKIPKWNISTFFVFWCLSSAITNPPVPIRHQIPDMTPQFRTFSMVPHVSVNQDYLSPIWQQGLKGFPGVNSNKMCHMTNGNRRKLGYKLSSWNCGRGVKK